MCQNQSRDSRGRWTQPFVGRNPNVFASTSTASSAPVTLRRGSLYRITGGPVARYRGTVANLDVFTAHGKPLVPVSRNRVRLADKEDVDAYLADASAA